MISYLALDGLRIGIVDDNSYSRRLVRTMLTSFGIRQINEAGSITEGWSIVVRFRPDILILDWSLPGGDGVALLDRIRCHPDDEIATQAVVFLSAHSGKRQVLSAVRLGANDFIVKPVSPRLLYDRLKRVVMTRVNYIRRDGRLVPVHTAGMPLAALPAPALVAEASDTADIAFL
ncbi:response regulator [Chthonobacter rhizosphaerae]|uniref:response regulator n=1 Tax=Chthonobacter rhizosphaerae TaxID=2735553 RepID=UPI0015EF0F49|nr:response regulator [Chthonobacter rhizosphaerae]